MQNSEKLCLKWNDFQENLITAFGVLRNDKDFSDVTLACEDGAQVEAHKVILASCSPFFMEVLKRNRHPHPLIYMRGVKAETLVAIVDFLYYGEANVDQENLDSFLVLAEELRLKGLTGLAEGSDAKYVSTEEHPKKIKAFTKPYIEPIAKKSNITADDNFPGNEDEPFSMVPVSLVGEDVQQFNEQVKSMMETNENTITTGNKARRMWTCKVCRKEATWTNMKTHIEANHIITNVTHSCDICGKNSRSRNGLRLHKAREHSTLQSV